MPLFSSLRAKTLLSQRTHGAGHGSSALQNLDRIPRCLRLLSKHTTHSICLFSSLSTPKIYTMKMFWNKLLRFQKVKVTPECLCLLSKRTTYSICPLFCLATSKTHKTTTSSIMLLSSQNAHADPSMAALRSQNKEDPLYVYVLSPALNPHLHHRTRYFKSTRFRSKQHYLASMN